MPSIGYGKSPEELYIRHNGRTSRLMGSDVPASRINRVVVPGVFVEGVDINDRTNLSSYLDDDTDFRRAFSLPLTDHVTTDIPDLDFELTPVVRVVSGRSARHDPEAWKFSGKELPRIPHSHAGDSKPKSKF